MFFILRKQGFESLAFRGPVKIEAAKKPEKLSVVSSGKIVRQVAALFFGQFLSMGAVSVRVQDQDVGVRSVVRQPGHQF